MATDSAEANFMARLDMQPGVSDGDMTL